jgi:hypothetical protein
MAVQANPSEVARTRKVITPEMKSDAEGNPLRCAILAAKTAGSLPDKSLAMLDIAVKYTGTKQKHKAAEILSQSVSVAESIDSAPSKALVLVENALAVIANKCAQLGQYEDAILIARSIAVAPVRDNTLVDIAGKCAAAGQYERAFLTAETIDDKKERAKALAEIVINYTESGHGMDDKAKAVLHRILERLD